MTLFSLVLLSLFTHQATSAGSNRTFPANFQFGVATASYQIEGAWNQDGKGKNIWDHISHTNPNFIDNQDNGDVACDSYNKWKEDVANVKALGVDFYRFSLSWSRILPTGRINNVNQPGIDYYRNLMKALLAEGIQPLVTIYHWDLPQPLQEIGGWTNSELEFIFVDYAKTVFENFGDLVKTWVTFNEPKQTCQQGYGTGTMAPGIKSSGLAEYLCAHTLIKAHARAWHLYDEEFRSQQNGRVAITIDTAWFEPASNDELDQEAAERMIQFTFGWYANPIYNSNYPLVMIDRIANRSVEEGFSKSRLPEFSEDEIDYISGTYDYLGLNVYTTLYVKSREEVPIGNVGYLNDVGVETFVDPKWNGSSSSWLKVVPWGMRRLANWVKKTYNNPEIIITENGFSDKGMLSDQGRIDYYKAYLSNLLDAILDDGVNCTGYTAWSLMDNFEWARGYSEAFGLYQVNFTDPERKRTPKDSAKWYAKVVETHCLEDCMYKQ